MKNHNPRIVPLLNGFSVPIRLHNISYTDTFNSSLRTKKKESFDFLKASNRKMFQIGM